MIIIVIQSDLGQFVYSNGWKSVEMRIVEWSRGVSWVVWGDGEDSVLRLGGPVGRGEGEAIVSPSIQRWSLQKWMIWYKTVHI